MELETFTTRKGATGIVVDNYKFRKSKLCKSSIAWRCCNTMCKSTCVSDQEVTTLMKAPTHHNHPADERAIRKDRLRESCKRRAVEEITERPVKIISEVVDRIPELEQSDMVKGLKDCIYRARQKQQRPNQPDPKKHIFQTKDKASSPFDVSNPDIPHSELGQVKSRYVDNGKFKTNEDNEDNEESAHEQESDIFTTEEAFEVLGGQISVLSGTEDMKKEMELVAAVKAFPHLYDKTDPRHNDREHDQQAWNSIAALLNIDVNLARKQWRTLRDYFVKRVHLDEKKGPNGSVNRKRWPLFENMTFLLSNGIFHNRLESEDIHCLDLSTNSSASQMGVASVASTNVSTSSSRSTIFAQQDKSTSPVPTFLFENNSSVKSVKLETTETQEHQTDPFAEEFEALGNSIGHDSDYIFLKSLIPALKVLSPADKFEFKHNIHGLLLTYLERSRHDLARRQKS